jgi:GT2 family glycosyltransferase
VPPISVIVPTHNERAELRATIHRLLATLPPGSEVVVVDDASTDGSTEFLDGSYGSVTLVRPPGRLGAAGARNAGATVARGDLLVFADAHVEPNLGWVQPFAAALADSKVGAVGAVVTAMGRPDSRGYGFTWRGADLSMAWLSPQGDAPYPVPLLSGCFIGLRREVFERIGGFDDGLVIWGIEDAEISLRLWLLGYDCLLVPGVEVAHVFRDRFPYPMDWPTMIHNALRVGAQHFGPARLEVLVAHHRGSAAFPAAFARLASGDAWRRRDALLAARQRDDDWFFDRFGIPFETQREAR